jgi:hypothetical protein
MYASFMITQVETTLSNYTNQYKRLGMQDLAIWQTLEDIYKRPELHDLVLASTREEAFDQMVKDNWFVDMGQHFYGLDYETIDELVLQYLKDNQLVKEINND